MHMALPMLDHERPPPTFAQRADIAYAVYAPEQRHAVEVAASQGDHLVKLVVEAAQPDADHSFAA